MKVHYRVLILSYLCLDQSSVCMEMPKEIPNQLNNQGIIDPLQKRLATQIKEQKKEIRELQLSLQKCLTLEMQERSSLYSDCIKTGQKKKETLDTVMITNQIHPAINKLTFYFNEVLRQEKMYVDALILKFLEDQRELSLMEYEKNKDFWDSESNKEPTPLKVARLFQQIHKEKNTPQLSLWLHNLLNRSPSDSQQPLSEPQELSENIPLEAPPPPPPLPPVFIAPLFKIKVKLMSNLISASSDEETRPKDSFFNELSQALEKRGKTNSMPSLLNSPLLNSSDSSSTESSIKSSPIMPKKPPLILQNELKEKINGRKKASPIPIQENKIPRVKENFGSILDALIIHMENRREKINGYDSDSDSDDSDNNSWD